MRIRILTIVALVGCLCIGTQGSVVYQQDFESLGLGTTLTSPWTWGVVNYDSNLVPTGGNYFPGGDPSAAIYGVETGQAGAAQGLQTLRAYADYGYPPNFENDQFLETLLYAEHTITAAEAALGEATFTFDYKSIDLGGVSTASIFLKVVDPGAGWATVAVESQAIFSTDTAWVEDGTVASIDISGAEGMLLQWGTSVFSQNYSPTGIGVDNLSIEAIPEPATLGLLGIFGAGIILFRRNFKI